MSDRTKSKPSAANQKEAKRSAATELRLRTAKALAVMAVMAVNALGFVHARAMLTFSTDGARTSQPEALDWADKVQTLLMGVNIPRPTHQATPKDFGLEFESVFIDVDDEVRLGAWWIEHPEPKGMMVVFHGYSSSASQLLKEANGLYDLGYSLFMVDFRGSGASNQHTTSVGYHEAQDVLAALKVARQRYKGPGPILGLGFSMGAAALTRAASLQDLPIDGLILVAIFDRMRTTVANRFELMGLPSIGGADLLMAWGSVIIGANAFNHNPVDYAAHIHIPTLMIHGGKDTRARPEEAQRVFKALASPQKDLIIVPDAPHSVGITDVIPSSRRPAGACFWCGRSAP